MAESVAQVGAFSARHDTVADIAHLVEPVLGFLFVIVEKLELVECDVVCFVKVRVSGASYRFALDQHILKLARHSLASEC